MLFAPKKILPLFLYNDFLRVGDDDVEIGIINRVQNRPRLIQEVKLDV